MSVRASGNTWRTVVRPAAWSCAALAAAALHVAAAAVAFFTYTKPEEASEVAGSVVVELAPTVTSQQVEMSTAAIGAASSEQTESLAKTAGLQSPTEPETPPVPPALVEPEPDLAFARSETEKKEVDKPTDQTATATGNDTSEAKSASVAMAPPRVDAPKTEIATAPQVGISPNAVRAKSSWNKLIAAHLERFKRFPAAARAQGITGSAMVEFKVGRDGTVSDARIVRSSGQTLLDEAALDMVVRASPVPAAPKDVSGGNFTLMVPIIFRDQ